MAKFCPPTDRVKKSSFHSPEDRAKMEEYISKALPVTPIHPLGQGMIRQQIEAAGGMKITAVPDPVGGKSFVYTCGFTDIGGKELLFNGLDESMIPSVADGINYLFKRHKEGRPLGNCHTVDGGDVAYLVLQPDLTEETLLKATQMFEPTRLYGILGYGVLILDPVCVKKKKKCSEEEEERLMGEEVLLMAAGMGGVIKGYKPLKGEAKDLQACFWCTSVIDIARSSKAKTFHCSGCMDTIYCSRKCQKDHWRAGHKDKCGRVSADDQMKKVMGPMYSMAKAAGLL